MIRSDIITINKTWGLGLLNDTRFLDKFIIHEDGGHWNLYTRFPLIKKVNTGLCIRFDNERSLFKRIIQLYYD